MRGSRIIIAALLCGALFVLAACGRATQNPRRAKAPTSSHRSAGQTPASSPNAIPSGGTASRVDPTVPRWLSYHAGASRTGAVVGTSPKPAKPIWSANLGSAVYGEPVILGNRVFVGTESDKVVALDRKTGRPLWSRAVGTPLTNVATNAGCGDVDPLGITSTLAIDPARAEIFAVGEIVDRGAVRHRLVGLDVATGAVRLFEDVDPPLSGGERPIHLLQRAGLAVANGRVYIGYGGNAGDCGDYHGWLVGAPESRAGGLVSFEVAPDGQGGAIWLSGGAPAIGPDGSVYVTTGNANPFPRGIDRAQYTESVVKLSSTLAVTAAFKDTTAGGDQDLATGNPVLLPGGLVFAVGKTQVGYVLKASDLSLVAKVTGVCGSDPDGGPAYDANSQHLFVPCRSGGIQVIDTKSWTLGQRIGNANGAPIVVGGTVWAASYPAGGLVAFDAKTGQELQSLDTGSVPNFTTPSFAGGMLYLGTSSGVRAYGS